MGTPITREGGYFVRLGQRAVGYRVDDVTYRKAEKLKMFGWAGLMVWVVFVIIYGIGNFGIYQDLLVWQQVGVLALALCSSVFVFFQIRWFFENRLARNEAAVDDGMPLMEQRWEMYQKMLHLQPGVLLILFGGLLSSNSVGREGFTYLNMIIVFALILEYVYFRFFYGKSKKTVSD